jgi:hypothetical protein
MPFFLYAEMDDPGDLLGALSNPVSLVFRIEALARMILFTWLLDG